MFLNKDSQNRVCPIYRVHFKHNLKCSVLYFRFPTELTKKGRFPTNLTQKCPSNLFRPCQNRREKSKRKNRGIPWNYAVFRWLQGSFNASRTEALCARPSSRTALKSHSEALDITGFASFSKFGAPPLNYCLFFYLPFCFLLFMA